MPARPPTHSVQAMWRWGHLLAWQATQPLQGVPSGLPTRQDWRIVRGMSVGPGGTGSAHEPCRCWAPGAMWPPSSRRWSGPTGHGGCGPTQGDSTQGKRPAWVCGGHLQPQPLGGLVSRVQRDPLRGGSTSRDLDLRSWEASSLLQELQQDARARMQAHARAPGAHAGMPRRRG